MASNKVAVVVRLTVTVIIAMVLGLGALPLLGLLIFFGSLFFRILALLLYGSVICTLIFWNKRSKKGFISLAALIAVLGTGGGSSPA